MGEVVLIEDSFDMLVVMFREVISVSIHFCNSVLQIPVFEREDKLIRVLEIDLQNLGIPLPFWLALPYLSIMQCNLEAPTHARRGISRFPSMLHHVVTAKYRTPNVV
jgi:hypothetical protein